MLSLTTVGTLFHSKQRKSWATAQISFLREMTDGRLALLLNWLILHINYGRRSGWLFVKARHLFAKKCALIEGGKSHEPHRPD